ncbi:MAG TPA: Fic family protein [Rhodocyclaceae bacterium]|nr:Fic family protein [Rhodocyclaceae bacterium]
MAVTVFWRRPPPGASHALMAMLLVSEVHPFNDGSGRLARLVMNAELSVVGVCPILIRTLFRDKHMDCLRALSREGDPSPFLKAMQTIQD